MTPTRSSRSHFGDEAEPKGIAKRSCRFALLSLVVSFLTLAASELARAHGGGLDSLGCHNDRKQGEYHCHRGELAGQSFASKAEAQETLRGGPPIPSRKSPSSDAYNRKLYGGWIDQDGDCQNTRHEVLIAESTVPVTLDAKGCRVVSGRWQDPYTGRVFTDPRRLDIDHFIPLAEVHRSGGHAWTPAQRRQYANDLSHPDTLIAVSASANRSKGDRDPVHWLPPNRAYRCGYLKAWVDLKRHWGLAADPVENQFVAESPCLKHPGTSAFE